MALGRSVAAGRGQLAALGPLLGLRHLAGPVVVEALVVGLFGVPGEALVRALVIAHARRARAGCVDRRTDGHGRAEGSGGACGDDAAAT